MLAKIEKRKTDREAAIGLLDDRANMFQSECLRKEEVYGAKKISEDAKFDVQQQEMISSTNNITAGRLIESNAQKRKREIADESEMLKRTVLLAKRSADLSERELKAASWYSKMDETMMALKQKYMDEDSAFAERMHCRRRT